MDKLKQLLMIMLVFWMSHSLADDAVAMVSDLQGAGLVQEEPLEILTELFSGQFVELETGAKLVIIYYKSGEEYVFIGPSRIYIRDEKPVIISGQQPTKTKLLLGEEGKVINIAPGKLAQAAIVFRGLDDWHLDNLNYTTVLTNQPIFRWTWSPMDNNIKFQFTLKEDKGSSGESAVLISRVVKSESMRLPGHIKLRRGEWYTWSVTPLLGKGMNSRFYKRASFKVADKQLVMQVEAIRPVATASFAKRLVFAVWLKQQQLKDEAKNYWKQLATERQDAITLQKLAK